MKNLNKAIALCACVFIASSAFAQGKGGLARNAGKALGKTGSAASSNLLRGAENLAKVSGDVAAATIRAARAAQRAARVSVNTPNGIVKIQPVSPFNFHNLQAEQLQTNLSNALTVTQEKQLINKSDAFNEERFQAQQLSNIIGVNPTEGLSQVQEDRILAKMSEFVKNKSLQSYLLNSLANKDYVTFTRDLADYYSLPSSMNVYELPYDAELSKTDIYSISALSYMKRHPHKMNLAMHEIMVSPVVSDDVKNAFRAFIEMEQLRPQHIKIFITYMNKGCQEMSEGLAKAWRSQSVTQTLQMYQDIRYQLLMFVKQNNRLPRWNARGDEHILNTYLELVMTNHRPGAYAQANDYVRDIEAMMSEHQVIPTVEDVRARMHNFYDKYGYAPRSASEVPSVEPLNEEEMALSEDIHYLIIRNNDFLKEFNKFRSSLSK